MSHLKTWVVAACATVALTGIARAVTFVCGATAGQTCTVTNLDTGLTTPFARGEMFVVNSANWRLSSNFHAA